MRLRTNNRGFTIVELMIAISVLSMLLLLATYGIMRISQSYYRGIIQANTQQAGRTVLDDITQNIQFSGDDTIVRVERDVVPGVLKIVSYCLGQQRYTFALNYQQITAAADVPARRLPHGLWRDVISRPSDCSLLDLRQVGTPPPLDPTIDRAGTDGKELLGERTRLMNFVITPVSVSDEGLFRVDLTLLYGDGDLVQYVAPDGSNDNSAGAANDPTRYPLAACKSSRGQISLAFCARSELTTVVGKRLR